LSLCENRTKYFSSLSATQTTRQVAELKSVAVAEALFVGQSTVRMKSFEFHAFTFRRELASRAAGTNTVITGDAVSRFIKPHRRNKSHTRPMRSA